VVTPLVIGYNVKITDKEMMVETSAFDRFDKYSLPEMYSPGKHTFSVQADDVIPETSVAGSLETTSLSFIENGGEESPSPVTSDDGLMDSAWPMYCHDTRHTGRSPYSTVDNNGYEKWTCKTRDAASGDVVIDNDGTIYIGSSAFHAVYPNGTMKWQYVTYYHVESAPVIDENGVLYFGTIHADSNYLYAFYPNGMLKWKYFVGKSIFSSPAIGNDGTIYFGFGGGYPPSGYIIALYPNGTLRWRYHTDEVVYSSPAIGDDGIVYCGSHDTYLYALYPNNGTLKWRYKTGHWIRTAPCIADDGTIYVVSLDNYLHAVNPDGTMKWKTDVGAGTSPTIGQDGTIYAGYSNLHAINPTDGSVKWTFNVGGNNIRGGTPCNSVDGTIYFGTHIGDTGNGELIAVNQDGTEKWRRSIGAVESAPAIGEDGTVYVGSNNGYLYAFGRGEVEADANGPYYGLVDIPVQFTGFAGGGYSPHSFHWDFGDTHSSDEQNPTHTYTSSGDYTVTLTVTDDEQNIATDTTFAWIQTSNEPPNKPTINGPTSGKTGISYDYTFSATDPDGNHIYLYIDWDDGEIEEWIGPCTSDEQIIRSHIWMDKGTYIIKAKAKDPYGEEGLWGTLTVSMPRNKMVSYNLLFLRFLDSFPILERLLALLIN